MEVARLVELAANRKLVDRTGLGGALAGVDDREAVNDPLCAGGPSSPRR